MIYDMIRYTIRYINRKWVDTRWQQYSTHNTEKGKLGSADRARLCELYPGICLTTEERARKTLS
jgi:hypothetical protein